MSKAWLKKNASSMVLLAGILLMMLAYYPSLFHSFRADTVTLVRQYALKTGFFDSVVKMYGISRDLSISGGDYTQFRPICYWLIGAEFWFLQYNFLLWQAVGIILHGVVVVVLYRLLLKISRKDHEIVAAFFAAFFASLLVSSELVIWQSCHSWILLVLFVLMAIHSSLDYIVVERNGHNLFKVVVYLLLACFTSEAGMFLALPIACYVFLASPVEKRLRALWAFAPAFIYGLVSYIDSSKASVQAGTEFVDILQRIWSPATLYNFFISVAWWLYAGFFPGELKLELYGRLIEIEPIRNVICRINWTSFPFWIGMACAMTFLVMFLKGFRKTAPFQHWFLSGAVFMCMAAYVFVLTVVRLNVRGLESLNSGLYYSYLFWVVFLVWIYSLINIDKILKISSVRYLCAVLATSLIIWNAVLLFKQNNWMTTTFVDNKKTVKMVNDFVLLHKGEPDFSFYVPLDYPGNYAMPFVRTKNPWTCSFVESMFPKYFNGVNPKYSFDAPTSLLR